ncbi:MAG TPA: DUF1254 domain-containing protein [Polyangia bacterium]|nr:DUF1254 domain-containing protein [Polyangia bacterium]
MSTPGATGELSAEGLGYVFKADFPTPETVARAYDEADLNRAVQAYRFFYPTVSGLAQFKGNADVGLVDNQTFGVLDTKPRHVIFTANSDTPYGPIMLDLRAGPMTIDLPAGPLIVVAMDINQRWVADMGVPGPDAGRGGKHLFVPPGYLRPPPVGYYVWRATTNRVLVGVRSLPIGGDVKAALERIQTVKVRPLDPPAGWTEPKWLNLTDGALQTTPLGWETTLKYWQVLHEAIESEPPYEAYRNQYGELAVLGIAQGRPFAPDARMRGILERAAVIANAQMRVEAFADRRPDRIVWADRKWEWAALRFEDGNFNAGGYADLDARDKWFFQAIGASPAMFRRSAGAGSLYWLGLRDRAGAYLDGGRSYRLRLPLPVPGKLFWSVTVYDAETRCEIQTDLGRAALRSLFELRELPAGAEAELLFAPRAPAGGEARWIKTIPGKGWFAYFRVYGPEQAAFDGSWKPGDFEIVT